MKHQLKVLIEFEAHDTPDAREKAWDIIKATNLDILNTHGGADIKLQKLEEGKAPVGIKLNRPQAETKPVETIDEFRGEYKWLSNFWRDGFQFEGKTWPSSEHAFQAMKTTDERDREEIRHAETPGKAKRLGMKVKLRPGWDDMRVDVMRKILEAKFTHSDDLKRRLLETGDAQLIEGNTWGDTFWGMCDGRGQNWLGVLLMELREKLRDGV